ncbi:single-stranded DNA-binding protein [Sporobacter termitidis]|nr:single-stranded DNA-binding protein [Sporobacter termitidis]
MNNVVELCGSIADKPRFSHMGGSESYFSFPLDIERLSGFVDTVNIIVRQEMLEKLEIEDSQHIAVTGELRSFNNKRGDGSRLVISVFAKELYFTDDEDKNLVRLTGAICKKPNLRKTPMGRQICDIMLAVNRRYGRSDYLPCIAWGRLAEGAAELAVGDTISLEGRIQSRKYIKNENGAATERTAFEVSIVTLLP